MNQCVSTYICIYMYIYKYMYTYIHMYIWLYKLRYSIEPVYGLNTSLLNNCEDSAHLLVLEGKWGVFLETRARGHTT